MVQLPGTTSETQVRFILGRGLVMPVSQQPPFLEVSTRYSESGRKGLRGRLVDVSRA